MKFVFIFVLLFFIACGAGEEEDVEIVARVGNEKLSRKNLQKLVDNHFGGADVFSRELNNWVEKKLLYRAALSVGLDKDLDLINQKKLFYENLLISSFIKIQTKKKTKTTKKEVSDYYLNNKNSFKRTDDEVVVKHFTFSNVEDAKKIKKELKKKKPTVDMQALLNRQKVETKTIKNSEAGTNHVGFLFSGNIGDVLGPKKHNEQFHVFQIIQKHKKGSFSGLEKVYDEIYQRINKEKEVLVLEGVLDSLYLNSDVFISRGF